MNPSLHTDKVLSKHFIFNTLPKLTFLLGAFLGSEVFAHGNTPPSLQGIAIPSTPGLLDGEDPIVVNKTAAIQLGKALFWDTALGSDGMACGSCHFHAGVDRRSINQIAPGMLHKPATTAKTFESTASGGMGGPNYSLKISDFPLQQFANPQDKNSSIIFKTDDNVSSSGSFKQNFLKLDPSGSERDLCSAKSDSIFHIGKLNTRQVQTRQAPSVINAGFYYRNFWDGRANNIFNGVSPYGLRDTDASIWIAGSDGIAYKQAIQLENAALASQAVAPVINATEMSCNYRGFADIGRKVLKTRPLRLQTVHSEDSVLGDLLHSTGKGLNTTYENLVKTAFAPRYWSGTANFGHPADINDEPYSHIEANFSLFFGLALQLYQQTLVSDQSPFDTPRIEGTNPQVPKGLNSQQTRGLNVFLNAHCAICHSGPNLSSASHPKVNYVSDRFSSLRLVNRKTLNGSFTGLGVVNGLLDEGFFNTSVTPTENDPGVGGTDPYGNPLSFSQQYFNKLLDGKPMIDPIIVNSCDMDNTFAQDYLPKELIDDPYITGTCDYWGIYAKIPTRLTLKKELPKKNNGRALLAIKGAFKVPSLRNVELTGPYMHNGSLLTLEQVVDFYFRGGNFTNPHHFATLVFQQSISDQEKADLVAFLKSLTDERVRWERAPFDHPQINVPHGHKETADIKNHALAEDLFLSIPAVGKNGRDATLGPLEPFDAYLKP